MIHIRSVDVQTLSTDRLYIRWTIEDTAEDIYDYHFTVYKAAGEAGPWEILADDIVDRYELVDFDVTLDRTWKTHVYKVRITHRQSGEYDESQPTSLGAPPDLIALEIRRRELLLWKEYAGKRAIVLQRKEFGPRCSCYDPVLEKRLVSRCPTCFDTTFVGGYLQPIWMWMQFSPSPKTLTYFRETQLTYEQTVVLAPPVPELHPRDVIVEPDSPRRWRVVQAKRTERFRTPVHQELMLSLIPGGDIEYQIPVDLETVFDIYFGRRNLVMTTVGAV